MQRSLVLAPDLDDRRLAAVFTAADAVAAFLAEAVAALEIEPEEHVVTGAQLCELLAPQPLDGLVFNCKGPPQPRAFAMNLLERIQKPPASR